MERLVDLLCDLRRRHPGLDSPHHHAVLAWRRSVPRATDADSSLQHVRSHLGCCIPQLLVTAQSTLPCQLRRWPVERLVMLLSFVRR